MPLRYFNTVGSKEGWTPSQFISSRTNRKKDAFTVLQKPEDFMDDEDIADAEESQKLKTVESFAGLGSTAEERSLNEPILDGLRTAGDTIGVILLRKMGWRDGQGVGPKIRRKARLGEDDPGGDEDHETHLFAPENSRMISFLKKYDRKGLGFEGVGESDISPATRLLEADSVRETQIGTQNTKLKMNARPRGGFGVGILNDNGSDEEDPYHIGPQISYNRIVGGEKKKKKKTENGRTVANPLISTKPVFISKKSSASKAGSTFRRCHDGRLPLDGFVLSQSSNALSDSLQENKYPAPTVPPNWKSSKTPANTKQPNISSTNYQSAATVAKLSNLEPKSRASILGETPLPGKSVFDYLSPTARSRIVSATQNTDLPPALNEAHSLHPFQPPSPLSLVPPLSPSTAHAALKRGTAGFLPYADDPAKLSRYRVFLETRAKLLPPDTVPPRAAGASTDDWVTEMQEFAHAAHIFRPASGLLATRFTTSSSTTKAVSDAPAGDVGGEPQLLTPPVEKMPEDPALQAAAVGMYGLLTRSVVEFYPTRLLCKRFNVKPPDHVASDPTAPGQSFFSQQSGFGAAQGSGPQTHSIALPQRRPDLVGPKEMDEMVRESGLRTEVEEASMGAKDKEPNSAVVLDPERNEALERERPGDAVFRAVFGSDSESEEEG